MPLEIRLLCTCSALMQSKKATPRDPLAKLSLPDRFMALFYLLQPLTYPLRKLGCIVLCRRSLDGQHLLYHGIGQGIAESILKTGLSAALMRIQRKYGLAVEIQACQKAV